MNGKWIVGLVLVGLALLTIGGVYLIVTHLPTPVVVPDEPSGPRYVPRNPDIALHGKFGTLEYMGEKEITLCGITHDGSLYGNEHEQVLIDSSGQMVWGYMWA
jgi:hypothetical protein